MSEPDPMGMKIGSETRANAWYLSFLAVLQADALEALGDGLGDF